MTSGFVGELRQQIRRLLQASAVPRIVAFGVDTLYLHWKVPVSSDLVAMLRALQESAAAVPLDKGGGVPLLELGGLRFEVKAHASRQAPIFLHAENVMDVHLNPTPAIATMPTIAIELRSVWLWQRGPHRAAQDTCDVLADLVPDGVVLPEAQLIPQVTRVDICADFQWGDTLKENMLLLYPASLQGKGENAPGLRTRADNFVSYWKIKKQKCTGATYGNETSDVSAGVYNKSEEIAASSGKTWFEDVWKASPNYVAGEDVWRLEYRLKREGLRSLQCPGVKRALLTWPDVAEHLEAIWRYLSGEWLVWRGQRTKHSRHAIDERWRPLHELDVGAQFHNGCADVLRKRIEQIGEMATAQTCGYLAQMKAHVELELGRDVEFEDALAVIIAKVDKHGEQSGRTLEMRCRERRAKFDSLIAAGARPPVPRPEALPPRHAGDGARMAKRALARIERRKKFVEGQRGAWRR